MASEDGFSNRPQRRLDRSLSIDSIVPVGSAVLITTGLLVLAGCGPTSGPLSVAAGEAQPGEANEAISMPASSREGAFTDVTLAAGIGVRHRLVTEQLDNIVDSVGAGAAYIDIDGDDWLDLIVLGGPRSPRGGGWPDDHSGIHLYRNLHNGRFENVTAGSGIAPETTAVAVAVADYDGDGDRDLYLLDRGPNRLFRNRGDGVFEDVSRQAGVDDAHFGVGATFFDKDRDGDLDLYVANYLEYDAAQSAYYSPDGYPGPLSYKAERDLLYENRGDGTFVDVSASSGIGELSGRAMSVVALDFDDDGDTDLFVANDATENFLFLNDGRGRFEEAAVLAGVAMGENGEQTAAMAADVGDVDGDGQLDLVVSDSAYGAFYRRLAPGVFRDDVMRAGLAPLCGQYVSWGQNLVDFDNDGDLDLFAVNADLHHLVGWEDLLLRNTGVGYFEDATREGGAYFDQREVGRSSITGDYDNDGDIDLFVTSLEGRHYLLRNDTPKGASWITLDLVGRTAREPVGARVRLEAAGRVWASEFRLPSTYLGQGDSRLHFGLGEGITSVDRVLIDWPDGRSQQVAGLATGQIKRLEEDAE